MVTGNEACGLGAVYGGATVCAWYPITPSTSLPEGFEKHAKRFRVDKDGKKNYALVQAEDELECHRRRHRRRLERRALVHGHVGPRHLADERVPGSRLLRRDPGRAVQHPARRPLHRHADAHAAARHHLVRLCLARRHQARAAVPGQSDRVLLDGRRSLRPRRAAADAGHGHVGSRHRHERVGDRRLRMERQPRLRPRQGARRRTARGLQGRRRASPGAAISTSTATPSPTARCRARIRPRAPSSRAAPATTSTRATPRTAASTPASSTASGASSTRRRRWCRSPRSRSATRAARSASSTSAPPSRQ